MNGIYSVMVVIGVSFEYFIIPCMLMVADILESDSSWLYCHFPRMALGLVVVCDYQRSSLDDDHLCL